MKWHPSLPLLPGTIRESGHALIATYRLFLGVDVSKDAFEIAFLYCGESNSVSWADIPSGSFAPRQADFQDIRERIVDLATPIETCAVIDHTGGYLCAPLVNFLLTEGCTVGYLPGGVAKQLRTKLLFTEAKTDHIDAKTLAYAAYLHHTFGFQLKIRNAELFGQSDTFSMLQLSRLRAQLVRQKVRIVSRLRQFLAAAFPEVAALRSTSIFKIAAKYPVPEDILRNPSLEGINVNRVVKNKFVELAEISVGVSTPALRETVRFWAQSYEQLDGQIKQIEDRLDDMVMAHPYGPILLSFPYIGSVRAAALIGLIKDIDNWATSGKLKKMFGFYGVPLQSGTSSRMKKGTGGSRYGKSILMQTIAAMARHSTASNDFKDCYERHVRRGIPTLKAMYKAASKLVDVLHHCLRTRQLYQYQGTMKRSGHMFLPKDCLLVSDIESNRGTCS